MFFATMAGTGALVTAALLLAVQVSASLIRK